MVVYTTVALPVGVCGLAQLVRTGGGVKEEGAWLSQGGPGTWVSIKLKMGEGKGDSSP